MEIVNRNSSEPFNTKDGSEIRSILDRTNSSAANQSLAEATLPPGGATQAHRHPRTEELYYILRGAGRMMVGTERREVGPGDGILIPPGMRHTIQNIGREPLVFLCCCAPPYSHEDTVVEPRAAIERQGRGGAEARGSRGERVIRGGEKVPRRAEEKETGRSGAQETRRQGEQEQSCPRRGTLDLGP